MVAVKTVGPIPLTEGQINALGWLWRVVYDDVTHPKIFRGTTGREVSLNFASTYIEGLGEIKMIEQSPVKNSIFADAARNGIRIAWIFEGQGGYFGGGICMAQLPGETKPSVYASGNHLRQELNPVGYMDSQ